jgi:hypothetical protein
MLLVVIFYVGLFAIFLRALPWVAKNHPKARNVVALVVESFSALGAANMLSLVAGAWFPSPHRDAPALGAVLAGSFALGCYYLGSGMAKAAYPVYLPFVVSGVLFLLAGRLIALVVGAAMLLIGAVVGILKYRELRSQIAPVARQVPQA